ncbi:MAG: hypothetical protein SGPRY_007096 [Prymnesium sp.]
MSPYKVTFGQEPRVGISSLPTYPELLDGLSTEAQLLAAIGAPAQAHFLEEAVIVTSAPQPARATSAPSSATKPRALKYTSTCKVIDVNLLQEHDSAGKLALEATDEEQAVESAEDEQPTQPPQSTMHQPKPQSARTTKPNTAKAPVPATPTKASKATRALLPRRRRAGGAALGCSLGGGGATRGSGGAADGEEVEVHREEENENHELTQEDEGEEGGHEKEQTVEEAEQKETAVVQPKKKAEDEVSKKHLEKMRRWLK